MCKQKFYRRWKRRFRVVFGQAQALLDQSLRANTPQTIHDLRVALRRARVLALVGTPVLKRSQAGEFRQWALEVSTALASVRDHDVIVEWLGLHCPPLNAEKMALRERARAWRRARPRVVALARKSWARLPKCHSSPVRIKKLRRQFLKQRDKIRGVLEEGVTRFHQLDGASLHEFRRRLRRLRYLRELVLRRRKQKTDSQLNQLIAFQEALGEMQNCAVVRDFFSARPKLALNRRVMRLAEAKERQWRKRAEKHRTFFRTPA